MCEAGLRCPVILKRETVATQTEEVSVTIPGGLDSGEKLMRGVSATVVMTIYVVLMRHWNSSTCRLANI